ncbi:MAG TPA: periplasmic heavy metal sensor [Spirochaetota bacterium]|nr:periplasmic heavy metal sensor [Spirochaetota bacterium]HQO01519.1 periplasmic heavy metal sensor [Spirochaetota bacterium]HQP47852.1 periplasmic heavy metal sensor [Spirochaetota bacterium]
MKKRIILTLSVMALISAFAADAIAQQAERRGRRQSPAPAMHHRCPGGPMIFHNPEAARKILGLNDSQVQRIRDININYKKQGLSIQEKLAPKRIHLKRLLMEDNVNLSQVRTQLEEISKLRVELHMLRIRHKIDIDGILTAEQRSKARDMHPRRVPRRGHDGPPSHRRRPGSM